MTGFISNQKKKKKRRGTNTPIHWWTITIDQEVKSCLPRNDLGEYSDLTIYAVRVGAAIGDSSDLGLIDRGGLPLGLASAVLVVWEGEGSEDFRP